jgi:hypothetical protein
VPVKVSSTQILSAPTLQPATTSPVDGQQVAGADVLVAVQGTLLSTVTDQNGRFTPPGVPVDQYLIVAASPCKLCNPT